VPGLGDPTSYLELAGGVPVLSSDGERIGVVEHVLAAAACARLPEPSASPAVMEADPDDSAPDDLSDKLKRAWNVISGNY